jgi:molybdenum cofactor synthesis domain-containing protein
LLSGEGFEVSRSVVPDESDLIAAKLLEFAGTAQLVVTTGGTGFGPRDVTPEATLSVLEREAPGLAQLMIAKGLESTPKAALSRLRAGVIGSCLVVNLPGSPRGAEENLRAILTLIPHILDLLAGDTEH